jgi:ureidoglycolate hydrolase
MSTARLVELQLLEVTPQSWAPFGQIPSDENTEHDRADLQFLWNDGHVNFIGHTNDEIAFTERGGAICELLNRHDTHTQTLMPFDADAYAVVAPAAVDFSRPEHFDTVRAFRLPRHAVVHLSIGTWHWGPYPLRAGTVRIFNIQGRGYARDNGIAWLTRDHGVAYEVRRDLE